MNDKEQQNVSHYLYLRTEEDASEVATELRKQGYKTETRLSADGENWLVLAQHRVVPSAEYIAGVRETMERLAERVHGEYDGWEVAVS
jgi:regulator of RNase E activity RraB